MKALVLSLLCLLIAPDEAKIFSRCELASIMKQNNLDQYHNNLDSWICIAYHASKYNTQAVAGPDEYGRRTYGIFQISDNWCSDEPGDGLSRCHKSCSAFTDDDITDDIACAKIIGKNHVPISYLWPWSINCQEPNMSKWSCGCQL